MAYKSLPPWLAGAKRRLALSRHVGLTRLPTQRIAALLLRWGKRNGRIGADPACLSARGRMHDGERARTRAAQGIALNSEH